MYTENREASHGNEKILQPEGYERISKSREVNEMQKKDCFVAITPRNDLFMIFTVIATCPPSSA
jgi:hypothetical protein